MGAGSVALAGLAGSQGGVSAHWSWRLVAGGLGGRQKGAVEWDDSRDMPGRTRMGCCEVDGDGMLQGGWEWDGMRWDDSSGMEMIQGRDDPSWMRMG